MVQTNAFVMVSRQTEALEQNEVYQGFLANDYKLERFLEHRPLETNEMRGVLSKWFYQGDRCFKEDRTYAIRVHVFDLYGIFTYPQDGSMPRFLFEVQLHLENAVAGAVMLAGIKMKFRVSTFAEAEIAAEHLWTSLGRPHA